MKRNRLIIYMGVIITLLSSRLLLSSIIWQSHLQLHTVLDVITVLLALFIGLLTSVRYYSQKNDPFLFIGLGFLGLALFDGYTTIVTSSFFADLSPSDLAARIAWGWFISNLFLALFLVLSWVAWQREGAGHHIQEQTTYLAMASLVLISFLGFIFISPPQAYYPETAISRPQEFIPGLFFLLVFVGYFYKGRWHWDKFEHWLLLAILITLINQTLFMPFSRQLFDTMFNMAGSLRVLTYILLLIGAIINMYDLFQQAAQHEQEIQRANKTLQREIAERLHLEQKIQESLQRRIRQVQTSTEIAQEIASAPALDVLFRQIVQLVKQRFGYYHAQVYTLEGENLVLQEGTGQTGQQLKEAGHQIPITTAQSLVARAALTGKPILSPDVSQEPQWLPNPLLPETKSEVVVPIKLGDQVLGVLDVQSNLIGKLDKEDQLLLMGLCGQIAVAINNRQLEAERIQAETALKQYAAELERSNRELAEFAYVASHDLQEPLRIVASYLQLLSRRYQGKLDADADKFINYAVDGAVRMQNLINDLLAYSRVGTQGQPFGQTDCESVLEAVLANLQMAIEENKAVVTHDPLPTITADHSQLMLLFQNLIGNAIKFHSDAPPQVHIQATPGKGEWVFSVSDNGIGIDPNHMERIFVIFQRLHSRSEYPGTGIGLAICKKIVERHNGRIWLDSEPGQGTTFYFSIPTNLGTVNK